MLFELRTDHACFTGDCDHDFSDECEETLKQYVVDLCDEARKISEQRDDLLAACKAYLFAMDKYGHPDKTDRLIRAAIKKAKGR